MSYTLSLSWDAPAAYPITLTEIKAHLKITGTAFDTLISDLYLPAAVAWAEAETARSIASKTHYLTMRRFPPAYAPIRLPAGKCTRIVSIDYVENGATTTLTGPSAANTTVSPNIPAGDDFQEDLKADFGGVIMPIADDTWPTTDRDHPAPVVITFEAGWTASTCPADVKLALMAHISARMDLEGTTDQFDIIDRAASYLSAWRLR
jgi:hypothetical protein